MKGIRSLLLAIAASLFPFAAPAEPIVLALEDADNFPWQMNGQAGVNLFVIRKALENLGHTVVFEEVPWKRCLAQTGDNTFDGCVAASFNPERMAFGVYPMKGDNPDATKRLHMDSYSLYVTTGSDIDWNGTTIENLSGPVGAQRGYSIVKQLEDMNVDVVEVGVLSRLFLMLQIGRLSAVAALTPSADKLIRTTPGLAGNIKKLDLPLVEKPYFLMLSHGFANAHPELTASIFKEIESVRDSPATENYLDSLGEHY